MGLESLANKYVKYLFDNYGQTRHVRRVASWIGLILLGVDRAADRIELFRVRQLRFWFQGRAFKIRYSHRVSTKGGIEIVEALPLQGMPDGKRVFLISNLSDAGRFHSEAEDILLNFVRKHP